MLTAGVKHVKRCITRMSVSGRLLLLIDKNSVLIMRVNSRKVKLFVQ